MESASKKSWVSGTVVRKLFPEVEDHSVDALTAVWDEVVDRIISEMMTLSEANDVQLHINVREDMVMELARLQFWLAERVIEKRVTGRELSSIDPEQEREKCLGSEGAETIRGTARVVHERIWSKRLEERWRPKSAKAIEREANPKPAKLAVKPVGKNHFIPRWFIRDHWATDRKVLRWRRTPDGWTSSKRGFAGWGYLHKLYSDPLEAYFSLLEGDAKRPIEMLLKTHPLNSPQREALVGFLVIQFLRNPYTIAALQEVVAPVIAELGHGDDPEMPRKAYESLYRNNEFYHRIAAPVMWSPWAIVRSERPVFVLPDTFCTRASAMDGMRLIAALTPTACFVTLPGLERQKRIVPCHVRADEDLARRISLALTQAAAEEFLSHPDFSPLEGDAESPSDLLEDIAGVVDATRRPPPILSSTSVESPIIRKGRSDVKKRFTEAQIIGFLREAEAGLPVKDLCRRHGFSEASSYLWRSKFGGMSVSDAKRLKELETENGRLKKLLAESQLEIEVTREVL